MVIDELKKIITSLILVSVLFFDAFTACADGSRGEICLPILMYHHVSKQSKRYNDYVVSYEEFESDLQYLRDNGWTGISVKNLLDWYDGTFTMPEKPVMITFDDAFESTASYAQPLLEEYGYCAVVAAIGSIAEKYTVCGEQEPEYSHLSWEALKELSECGNIEVQCHTWDMHAVSPRLGCSKIPGENIGQYRSMLSLDLSRFLRECEKNGVNTTLTIAYPYGAFSSETTEAVRDMGFLAAFTCNERVNRLTGDREELFFLSRFNRPYGITSEKFFEKLEETVDRN